MTKEEALRELIEYLRQAVEFGKEQMPLVAQEIIRWAIINHSIFLALALVLGCVARFYFHRQAMKRWATCHVDGIDVSESAAFFTVGAVCAYCASAIVSTIQLYWLLMVLAAPKVYLLNYLVRG